MNIKKMDLLEVFSKAEEEVFQEGFTEAVKKVKHLIYKQSHLQRKIRIAEALIKKSNDQLAKTEGMLENIKKGDFNVLGSINLKEDFSKEESGESQI